MSGKQEALVSVHDLRLIVDRLQDAPESVFVSFPTGLVAGFRLDFSGEIFLPVGAIIPPPETYRREV